MIAQRLTLAILDCPTQDEATADLTQALEGVPGVIRAYVNPSTEMAYVQADPSLVDAEVLVRAVGRAGCRAGTPTRR
jgi:copper chaperone CopZ